MFGSNLRRLTVGTLLIVLASAALSTSVALAGKPRTSYSPTLAVTWTTSVSSAGNTSYIVSGCGYNAGYGGVNIVVHTPVSVQFAGQPVDTNGCISLSNFWTQGPGHYTVDAYQKIGRKDVLVASTSFDL
jgi:hypothetical protein